MFLMKYLTPWKSATLIQIASKRGRAGRSTEGGLLRALTEAERAVDFILEQGKMCK
ncbi:MAG: hypothetical protein QOH39_905 [Verrucomicrobiota bacterium]|jgi:hypothetical protein